MDTKQDRTFFRPGVQHLVAGETCEVFNGFPVSLPQFDPWASVRAAAGSAHTDSPGRWGARKGGTNEGAPSPEE